MVNNKLYSLQENYNENFKKIKKDNEDLKI